MGTAKKRSEMLFYVILHRYKAILIDFSGEIIFQKNFEFLKFLQGSTLWFFRKFEKIVTKFFPTKIDQNSFLTM